MPAKSKQQFKYIWAMRNKYKSKKNAPKSMKWAFDKEWTKNVPFKELPTKIKESFNHILNFKSFNETVIEPYDFNEIISNIKSMRSITMDELKDMFVDFDIEFIDIDYFKSKLQTDKEIELVPVNMPHIMPGLRFAAHNVYTNKMYICVVEDIFIETLNGPIKNNLLDLLEEILRHESIHKQQAEKRPNIQIRNLENSPMKMKKYFSSTDEIMAYADSFITQCRKRGLSDDGIVDLLKTGKKASWVQDVYSKMDTEVQNRFRKYVYQYLDK
jgi:hypothetical protein